MRDLIAAAIREKRLVEFNLHGLVRIGEPHLHGIRAGTEQLLVFQTSGSSRSGRLPNWRTVLVDEISGLRVLDERFLKARLSSDQYSGWDEIFHEAI